MPRIHPQFTSRAARSRQLPALEALENRLTPAVTALFNTGVLSVTGDAANNNIVVSADASGALRVTNNGQNIAIQAVAGTPTRAGLSFVSVNARGGHDSITLDRSLNTLDANGKLAASPNAELSGGAGDDFLNPQIGGFLGGVIGNPIVGNVVQRGDAGNDFLNSGFGNDVMLGGTGNDTLQWLPGTLLDSFDGGDGRDTAIVVGNDNNQGDAFVLGPDPNNPGGVLFQRTNLVPFFITMDNIETVNLQTQSGDDTITINNLAGTDVQKVVADGGLGNDILDGSGQLSASVQLKLLGNAGNDNLKGGAGSDRLEGGTGDDRLDGNNWDNRTDRLIGGSGADTFVITVGSFDVVGDLNALEFDMIVAA